MVARAARACAPPRDGYTRTDGRAAVKPMLRLHRLSCHLLKTGASSAPSQPHLGSSSRLSSTRNLNVLAAAGAAATRAGSSRPSPPPNWRLAEASPNADSYKHGANQSPPFPCEADSHFAKLDPTESTPSDAYKLIISAVTPRPICFISTIGGDGTCNLSACPCRSMLLLRPT